MANLIKKVKIMQEDGTFTDYIPLGAEAKNINVDGESVEIKLNKQPYYYNTVANMIADVKLKKNTYAQTAGYAEINDGYEGLYYITDSVVNNDIVENLNNGLYAKKIFNKSNPSINDFRKFCTNENDYLNWTSAFNFAITNFNSIKLSNKIYYINDTLSINKEGVTIEGNSTLSSRIALIPSSTMSSNFMLKLLNNNIEIRNLYIQGSRTNADSNNSAIYIYGSQIKLNNIKIRHMKGYGINFNFPSYDCILDNIQIYDCDATGMVIDATDCQFNNCFVHDVGRHGYEILRGSNFFNNCKAYLTGKVNAESVIVPDTGIGFYIHNTAGSHTCMLTNCHAQECGFDGFKISNSKGITLENCISDSNSVYLDGVGINIVNSDYTVLKNCLIVNKAVLLGWTKTALNVYGHYNNIDVTINTIDYSQQGFTNNTKFFSNILGTNRSSTNKIIINNIDYLPLDYENPMCFDNNTNSVADDFVTYVNGGSATVSSYIQRNDKYQVFSIGGTTDVNDEAGISLTRKTLKASITNVDVSFLRKCSKETGLVIGCKIAWYNSNNDLLSTDIVDNIDIFENNTSYKKYWTEFYNTFEKPTSATNYILSIYLKVETATITGSASIKDLKIMYS